MTTNTMRAGRDARIKAMIAKGRYLPQGYAVQRAYTMRDGRDVQAGWDVLVNGQWGNRFATKRDALQAIAHEYAAA